MRPGEAVESAVAPVAPAATVLLLRDSPARGRSGIEVLMTRRAAALAFMGGLWVFPGGRLDPADLTAPVPSPAGAHGRMLDAYTGEPLPADLAHALHVTACRETFEEAGVLLVRNSADGSPLAPAQLGDLTHRRADSESDAASFVRLLEAEALELETGRLVYWSHWVTPSAEKRRFDTRFFAVRLPPGQEASVEEGELTQYAWLGEDDVRERLACGEVRMAPPTLATLEDLWRCFARHGDLETLLEAERARPVPPILPKMIRTEAAVEVVMPWDAAYAALPGESGATWDRYPDELAALPSRRVLTRA